MKRVNVSAKLSLVTTHWDPKVIAELNGQHVLLVKIKGEFVWHHHAEADEMFLVVRGRFRMEFRDRTESLAEGDLIVVPRGVEHRPVADEECCIMLFEPAGTVNTGNVRGELTRASHAKI